MFDHTLFGKHEFFNDEFEEENYYQEARSRMLERVRNDETLTITNFMKSIGYNKPVGFYRNISDCELTIYTTNPGIIIGKRGANVDKLKAILSDKYGGNWKINFVEIRGGFANTGRDLNDTIDNMISVLKDWKKSSDAVDINTVIDLLEFTRKEY